MSRNFPKFSQIFFCQFFHENHLFFKAFEIVIRINGYLILTFFQKMRIDSSWILKYLKNLNLHFFFNSNNCPIQIHIMFTSNYLINGPRFLPWYNLGFTQFLKQGHNKLMIAQTQCSQKLVEKFWLRKNYNKHCQVWTMVGCRFELQTLARNCVLG
jgi:hypothetical protein